MVVAAGASVSICVGCETVSVGDGMGRLSMSCVIEGDGTRALVVGGKSEGDAVAVSVGCVVAVLVAVGNRMGTSIEGTVAVCGGAGFGVPVACGDGTDVDEPAFGTDADRGSSDIVS